MFSQVYSLCPEWLSFTEDIIDRNVSYIRKEIFPLIESGTYGRKQEEDEIMQVLSFYK